MRGACVRVVEGMGERGSHARSSRLARFNTSPFTLHEHCGSLLGEMQLCFARHGMSNVDPVAMEEEGWKRAAPCETMWQSYIHCGTAFLQVVDQATAKCKVEAEALARCAERQGTDCLALENAVLQCSAAVIQSGMAPHLLQGKK